MLARSDVHIAGGGRRVRADGPAGTVITRNSSMADAVYFGTRSRPMDSAPPVGINGNGQHAFDAVNGLCMQIGTNDHSIEDVR